jgi:hypothetical protein
MDHDRSPRQRSTNSVCSAANHADDDRIATACWRASCQLTDPEEGSTWCQVRQEDDQVRKVAQGPEAAGQAMRKAKDPMTRAKLEKKFGRI